jgi:hypothetical protein
MFPHCLLTVSNATINDLLARFDGEPQAADETEVKTEGNTKGERPTLLSELMALIRENSEKLVDLVSSSIDIGQSQAGEYVVDGDTYNAMIPVSVDTRAIADGIVDLTDKLIHSEPVTRLQAVLRRVDIDIPLETPVIGDVPTVTATVYACQDEAGNANGPLYVNAGIAGANATPLIQGQVRVDGENARVKFEIPAFELEVKYEQFQSDNGGFARADITPDKPIRMNSQCTGTEIWHNIFANNVLDHFNFISFYRFVNRFHFDIDNINFVNNIFANIKFDHKVNKEVIFQFFRQISLDFVFGKIICHSL